MRGCPVPSLSPGRGTVPGGTAPLGGFEVGERGRGRDGGRLKGLGGHGRE